MKLRGNPLLKKLDRYFGVPVIALLGLTPRRPLPGRLRRIGLLRTAAIGDTLLLAGPLEDLRAAYPGSELILITGENNAEAGALVAEKRARHLVIPVANLFESLRLLRKERFDLLIDSGAWPRLDAVLTALSGAGHRVGFRSVGQHRHFAYDVAVPHSADRHELENFRSLLGAVGIPAANAPTLLADLPEGSAVPGSFAVFHPWGGGFRADLREWPSERWVELGLRLADYVETLVISGTTSERPRAERLVQAMADHGCRALTIAGEATLARLAATLKASRLAVSVNTGVMHLGAIVGAPTIGLHGPTNVARWGPVGPRCMAVASAYPDCGFLNHGFEYDGRRADCMLGVSVDAVANACKTILHSS